MTYSLVNVGVIANDGNGDPLRDAFIIVNDNFSEVNDFIESQVTQEQLDLQLNDYVLVVNYDIQIASITASITSLGDSIEGFANSEHTHIIDDITGLTTALNGKVGTTAYNLQIAALNDTIAALTQRIVDIENSL